MEDGYVNEFLEKESKWFNYIKKKTNLNSKEADVSDFSFQGIGNAANITTNTTPGSGGAIINNNTSGTAIQTMPTSTWQTGGAIDITNTLVFPTAVTPNTPITIPITIDTSSLGSVPTLTGVLNAPITYGGIKPLTEDPSDINSFEPTLGAELIAIGKTLEISNTPIETRLGYKEITYDDAVKRMLLRPDTNVYDALYLGVLAVFSHYKDDIIVTKSKKDNLIQVIMENGAIIESTYFSTKILAVGDMDQAINDSDNTFVDFTGKGPVSDTILALIDNSTILNSSFSTSDEPLNIAIWLGWVASVFSETNGGAADYSQEQWQLRQEHDFDSKSVKPFMEVKTRTVPTKIPSDNDPYIYDRGKVITISEAIEKQQAYLNLTREQRIEAQAEDELLQEIIDFEKDEEKRKAEEERLKEERERAEEIAEQIENERKLDEAKKRQEALKQEQERLEELNKKLELEELKRREADRLKQAKTLEKQKAEELEKETTPIVPSLEPSEEDIKRREEEERRRQIEERRLRRPPSTSTGSGGY